LNYGRVLKNEADILFHPGRAGASLTTGTNYFSINIKNKNAIIFGNKPNLPKLPLYVNPSRVKQYQEVSNLKMR